MVFTNLEEPILDGMEEGAKAASDYAIPVIVAIVMVFAVLLVIIGITSLIFKLTGLFDLKKELDAAKKSGQVVSTVEPTESVKSNEIKDDDMMVAALIASIDYQNEVKTDVKVVSIKEIK